MASKSSPLTPRSALRTELVQLEQDRVSVNASLERLTKRIAELTNHGEGFSGRQAEQESIHRLKLISAYTEAQDCLNTVMGFDTITYFAKGGSLEELAKALKKPPEEEKRFIQNMTPVCQRYQPVGSREKKEGKAPVYNGPTN